MVTCKKPIPLEVVEIILSNLGVPDLLNCRLVNLDWNQECLKQLRKSKGRKHVDATNIGSVVKFVTKSTNFYVEPLWLFPFELIMKNSQQSNEDTTLLENFSQQVSTLIELAPESIVDVVLQNMRTLAEDTFRPFVQILSKCSSHLRTLEVVFIWDGFLPHMNPREALKILKHENLTFPRLKILSITATLRGNDSPAIAEETLGNALIQRSPNLEELKCLSRVYFDQNSWPLPTLHKLKKLTVRQPPCDRTATEFATFVPPPHIIPNLEYLSIFPRKLDFENEQQTQSLRALLISFSSKLKFLVIENFACEQNSANVDTVIPIKFPVLPRLEHLRIGLNYSSWIPIYANLEQFNFSQPNFPSLKSVDIDFGLYLGIKAGAGAATTFQNRTFDTVRRLRLRVAFFLGLLHSRETMAQEYMTHVQCVFPNVNNLSLAILNSRYLRPVLGAVFGSKRGPRIHTFELITFFGDYSANAALSGECASGGETGSYVLPINNMKNVTKFRVQNMYCYIKETDLRWFTEQFPNLAQIEMLIPRGERWSAEEAEFLQLLKKFSNNSIKVDHHDYNWLRGKVGQL